LVSACRYPPVGRRSFGPSRGLLYGGPDYAAGADATVLAIGMIESTAAVDHVDEILAVDGIDGIYVGPNDLALSGGWPPIGATLAAGPLADAIVHVITRARQAGVPAGIFAPTGEQAVQFADWGYQLITPGNDVGLLRAESLRRIAMLRGGSVT